MNTDHYKEFEDTNNPPKNICPICEALGFPICNGHGGGKNGNSEEEKEQQDGDKKINANSTSQIMMSLVLRKPSVDIDSPEIDFTARSQSILNIDIDAGNNRLCYTRGNVSIETFNRIKELLESALEEFKKANPDKAKQLANIRVIADEDNIVIQMPSSKLFNSFIKQLMHDNLLPRLQIPKTNIERQNKSDSMDDEVSSPIIGNTDRQNETLNFENSTAPTPFSMQPMPLGYST